MATIRCRVCWLYDVRSMGRLCRAVGSGVGSGMGRIVRVIAVAGLLMVVAGCSDAESVSTTTSSSSTSTTESTTTTSATSTTTSTLTTSTTLDEEGEVEAAVEAAYFRTYEVFASCHLTLPDCDPASAYRDVYALPTYEAQVLGTEQTKAEDLTYGPPLNPAWARSVVLDVSVDAGGESAVVTFCTLAGEQEFVVAADGSRSLTENNDTIPIEWGNALMSLGDDEVWRVYNYDMSVGGIEDIPVSEIDQRLAEGEICGGLLVE